MRLLKQKLYGWFNNLKAIKYTTIFFYILSTEDELRSLSARGKKLPCSLVVQLRILLCLLPDSSRAAVVSPACFGLYADITLHRWVTVDG